MIGQPRDQQHAAIDLKHMAVGGAQARRLELIEAEVTFEYSEEALDVATFAPITPILRDPGQGCPRDAD